VNYGDSTFTIVDTDPTSATFDFAIAGGSTGGGGGGVAVIPDGTRVIFGTSTGFLIIDAQSGAAIAGGSTGGSGTGSEAVTPDGAFALILTTSGQLFLIDIRPGSPTENLAIAGGSTRSTVRRRKPRPRFSRGIDRSAATATSRCSTCQRCVMADVSRLPR